MKRIKNIEEVTAIGIALLLLTVALLLGSCTSFDKLKRKYGNKAVEIETIPYQKAIAPDSAMLHTRLDDLLPNIPQTVTSGRSAITVMKDASGGLTARAYCDTVIIHDSIPYLVEKIIFKEVDLDKYILKKDADKEKKSAVEMALLQERAKQTKKAKKLELEIAMLEGKLKQAKKENNLTFFDKVKNTAKDIGLGLGLIIFLLLIVLFFAKKIANKFFPLLLVLFMFGCAHFDLSRPFVVEGIRYESGEVYYELSQVKQNGKKQYTLIKEEAGAKKLFDTVYLEARDIRFIK